MGGERMVGEEEVGEEEEMWLEKEVEGRIMV